MAIDPEFGRRARTAKRKYEEAHDSKLSNARIGELVGDSLGRKEFSASTVRAWFEEGQEPDSLRIVRALAGVLEADPSWLAWGDAAPYIREAIEGAAAQLRVAEPAAPSWKRAAKEHGGEIAKGSTERPGAKGRAKNKAAGDRRPKK